MQGNDLFEDMGYVDDDLVDGALKAKASRGWRASSRWLAAACVAVAVLVGWGVWSGTKPAQPTQKPVSEEAEAENEVAEGRIEIVAAQTEVSEVSEVAEIEPMPVSETNGTFGPAITEPDAEVYPTKTMIESYPSDGTEACYDYAVDNGTVGYSVLLTNAMDELGDAVLYRVYVEIFKDGVQLAADDPEVSELMTSLINDGIVSAIETVYKDEQPVATYDTLHATYGQLQQFQGDPNHGWMLFLYAERAR